MTITQSVLMHHGIKGMKWGIRRDRSAVKSNRPAKISIQFFANKASSRKTVRLNKDEYAHVMSELMSNITPEQKTYPTIIKPIGNYTYVFENNYDDTYRVIGKKRNYSLTKRR